MPDNIQIVITDLTQMPTGDRVCIAGINERNNCYRLCWNDDLGVPKELLKQNGEVIIRPKAKITVDLQSTTAQPPHIEDRKFDPSSLRYIGLCNDQEWKQVLERSSYSSVHDIYDGYLQNNRWVAPGARTKSLGTLTKVHVKAINIDASGIRGRLIFLDNSGDTYDYPISDLAFRDMIYDAIRTRGRSSEAVTMDVLKTIQGTDHVYLRIGLARPWSPNPAIEKHCYAQITGIYTFPDYLNGRCFADF